MSAKLIKQGSEQSTTDAFFVSFLSPSEKSQRVCVCVRVVLVSEYKPYYQCPHTTFIAQGVMAMLIV